MNPFEITDLSWGVLIPAALLLLAPMIWVVYVCISRPRRGLLLCILWMPIYVTSDALIKILASVFDSSQAIIPVDILLVLVFGGFLLTRRASNVLKELNRYPVCVGLSAFLAAGLFSLLNSNSIPHSLMALLAYFELFVLAFVVEAVPVNLQDLENMVRYWMYSYAVVLGVGLFGIISLWAGWENPAVHARQQVIATFRFPNQLSIYLTITLPLLLSLSLGDGLPRRIQRLVWFSMPFALALVWFCGSRSGLASVGIAAAVVGAFHVSKARMYVWAAMAVLIFAVSLGISRQTFSGGMRSTAGRYTNLLNSRTQTSEISFYEESETTAVDAFLGNPIFGAGVGAVLNRTILEDQPHETHITFLGILGETGLLGTCVCVLTIGFAVRNLLRARELATSSFVKELANGALAALAGCFVHGLANYDWRSRHLWLLLALTSVVRMAARQECLSAQQTGRFFQPRESRFVGSAAGAAPLNFY